MAKTSNCMIKRNSRYLAKFFLQPSIWYVLNPNEIFLACNKDEECTDERICEDKGNGPVCCKPFKGIQHLLIVYRYSSTIS
jgi:hypothetical protein